MHFKDIVRVLELDAVSQYREPKLGRRYSYCVAMVERAVVLDLVGSVQDLHTETDGENRSVELTEKP